MNYLTLGRSGLRVSPLCLGTMTFGEDWGWGSTEQESHQILDAYRAAGGNFIDTANVYTKGHSEAIIGSYLANNPGVRDHLVIATKFYSGMTLGDPNSGGASRKAVIAQLNESLRRLGSDYVDLYWMHAWDKYTPVEETMRVLDDIVRSGKVRYIGFSDTPAWKCAEAQTLATLRGWTPLIALQIEYSLRERSVEGELVPMAKELGLGVVPWSPLAGGILSGKHTRANAASTSSDRGNAEQMSERDYDIVDVLLRVAKEADTTPAAAALAWLSQRQGVSSIILGARRMDQLSANMASLSVTLSDAQVAALDDVSKPALPFPIEALEQMRNFAYAATNINGTQYSALDFIPRDGDRRY